MWAWATFWTHHIQTPYLESNFFLSSSICLFFHPHSILVIRTQSIWILLLLSRKWRQQLKTVMSFIKSHLVPVMWFRSSLSLRVCLFGGFFLFSIWYCVRFFSVVFFVHFVSLSMHLIRSSTRAHSSLWEWSARADGGLEHLIKIAQRDENHRQWFSIKRETSQTIYRLDRPHSTVTRKTGNNTITIATKPNENEKLTRPQVIQKSTYTPALPVGHTCASNAICKYQTANNIIKITK